MSTQTKQMRAKAPWLPVFKVAGDPNGHIVLHQVGRNEFALGSELTYAGETGLERRGGYTDEQIADIRKVTPAKLPTTDLTSVPRPARWFVGQYGVHTPAALIHDRLIGSTAPQWMIPEHADRYFRFMLKALGVRFLRRWTIWTAVAFRSRFVGGTAKRLSVVVWLLASVAGIVTFGAAAAARNWPLVVASGLAPLLFAGLWWRQYGAGVVAAYAAPWVGPPTLLAFLGYVVWWVLETVVGAVLKLAGQPDVRGDESTRIRAI